MRPKMLPGVALLTAVAALAALAGHLRQPWFAELRREVPEVDPHRLRVSANRLVTFHRPRDSRHPEQLAGAADYLASELEASGAAVTRHPFSVAGGKERYVNVVGRYGPSNGAPRVVVGAHYDAHGEFPGADDNASGVSVLLALGPLLQAHAAELKGPVELVAFTLEERTHLGDGLQGSTVYAWELAEAKVPVKAMLSLEMLGCYSDAPGSQRFPFPGMSWMYPDRGNFLAVVAPFWETGLARTVKGAMRGAAPALPVESINAPGFLRGVHDSDHYPFVQQGMAAAMVTDTAYYRNARYHTAEDTLDTLDYGKMAEATRAVFGAVMALDAER